MPGQGDGTMGQSEGCNGYLRVEHITKRFGSCTALDEVSFEAGRGEFICVLGPSGCGKTTLLRVVAGLESQDAGRVMIQGKEVSRLPVSRRNVGIVFQSYALFPNLTAEANVGYGLRNCKNGKKGLRDRVQGLLDLVGLSGMGRKFPAQLSGGQQQRVALARAMALSPDLLLLDEPLSALDAQVRVMLRAEIKRLQQRLGVTTLMVTHDQEEALTMADRILVMEGGAVKQQGTPLEVYHKPATPFVASFIGSMNFLANAVKVGGGSFRIGEVGLQVDNGYQDIPPGERVTVAFRPEDVLVRRPGEAGTNLLAAQVHDLEFRGPLYRVNLGVPLGGSISYTVQADIQTEVMRRLNLRQQMEIVIQLPPDRIRVYVK
jgi:iron(III) transport system ATP-binding protein